jgi:hypothetical protein
MSGLGVVGRDYYGVFPLKGKLLNVRDASGPQILKNEEIQHVAKIMGLQFGKQYDDLSSLRYKSLAPCVNGLTWQPDMGILLSWQIRITMEAILRDSL